MTSFPKVSKTNDNDGAEDNAPAPTVPKSLRAAQPPTPSTQEQVCCDIGSVIAAHAAKKYRRQHYINKLSNFVNTKIASMSIKIS